MLEGLAEAALRALLLAGAVQCVLWLLRVRRAQLLLAAWTVVLVASVAMPVVQQVTPLRGTLDPALPASILDGASDFLQRPSPPYDAPETLDSDAGSRPSPVSWPVVIYLVVGSGLLLRLALGVGLSVRLLARAVPANPDWAQGARVRISRDVTGPVTIANVVLLPSDAPGWPAETKRAVLAHEQAHVERWDFAVLILSQLNRAVFWFSPAPWWLHRRLVALSELASDDRAIACVRDPLRYAEILLEMGRRSGTLLPGPAMARPATLSHRIDRIVRYQCSPCPAARSQGALLMAGVATLSFAAGGTLSHPVQQPVIVSLVDGWDTPGATAQPPAEAGGTAGQGSAAGLALEAEAAAPVTATDGERLADGGSGPGPVVAPPGPTAVGTPQLAGRALQQAVRRQPRALPKPSPAAPGLVARAAPGGSDRGTRDAYVPPAGPVTTARPPEALRDVAVATMPGGPVVDVVEQLPSHGSQPKFPAAAVPADFRHIIGSSCNGTIAIGPGAISLVGRQPFVVPGQNVPARAHFHVRNNGAAWVRFDAFGQQPLELPLVFTRNGMTWTGEYGIAYTVRAAGHGGLTGLASFYLNASAKIDLTCATAVADAS